MVNLSSRHKIFAGFFFTAGLILSVGFFFHETWIAFFIPFDLSSAQEASVKKNLFVFCALLLAGPLLCQFIVLLYSTASLKKLEKFCRAQSPSKGVLSNEYLLFLETLKSTHEKIACGEQRLQFLQESQKTLLECLPEGVVILDKEGIVCDANMKASKFLGTSMQNLLGKSFEKIESKQPGVVEKCEKLLKRCLTNLMIVTDTISRNSVSKIYLDMIAVPIRQDAGSLLILQDNSSHYKVLEMGKEFVANASHELRTPITIIKGFSETLKDLPEISADMLDEIIDKIVRNCIRMNNLIKNLLLLADLDYLSRARMQKNSLIPIIENCCHTLLTAYQNTHIETFYNKEQIPIYADADLFELAIYNLIENAVKYSPSPATITITMEEKPDAVSIAIRDRGRGIPKKDLQHIFDRFYTVNKAHSRKLGGAGLGLSIVKTIIEKHEGDIEVFSKVNEGTCFQISLPKV